MGRLVLGTVQLGMRYGIANTTGQPDATRATAIVRAAWENGIRAFDTAQDYGESERMLGVAFQELDIANEARVISKLSKGIDFNRSDAVIGAVKGSIERLGVPRLYGLLVHKEEWDEEWIKGLDAAVAQGLIDRVGVSVYSPERALQAIETDGITIVQIPSNILDRRFERAGVFDRAKQRGVGMYVRGVFLQGLFLLALHTLPMRMQFARSVIARVHALAQELKITPQVLALQYVKTAFPDAHILVGAETVAHVRENVAAWNREAPAEIVQRVHEAWSVVDEHILDPRTWPTR